MGKPKLTPWIDGSVKPTIPGVYERDYRGSRSLVPDPSFAKWSGVEWKLFGDTVLDADNETRSAYVKNLPWRGLAEDPNK